ncbi:LolA family protein [Sphingobium yanoikuyae]
MSILSLGAGCRTIGLVAALAMPVVAQAQGTQLSQVQQHVRALDTMTAQFTQTDRNGRSLTGELKLKRPGKVRFQYEKGVPLLVVGDGKALTMIDYQVRQVTRLPIGSSPLSALLDPDKDISKIASVSSLSDGKTLIIDARDPKHPEHGTYRFSFARVATAPAGLILQGWSVIDPQGNRTVVHLKEQRLNVPVSDNAFKWVDPRPRAR